MGYVIADLPAAGIDRLEGLWRELLDHHLAAAPHLAALGTARDPADSWRVRRTQYLQWLAVPRAAGAGHVRRRPPSRLCHDPVR